MDLDSLSFEDIEKINPNAEDAMVLLSEAVAELPTHYRRYQTLIPEFDRIINGGLKDGDLMIVSGISGEGKTTLCQTISHNLCLFNVPVAWFSYELSNRELDKKFRDMGIAEYYKIYVPKKNTTGKIDWIKQKITESCIRHKAKVFFIDHIDFLTPTNMKSSDNREVILKCIATELKSLAVELEVAIVCMAHLRKLPDGKKEPDMQDIGYSAGIFQLADYVLIIWREKLETKQSLMNGGEVVTNNSFLKIVKNRETGKLKLIKLMHENGKFKTHDWVPSPDDVGA